MNLKCKAGCPDGFIAVDDAVDRLNSCRKSFEMWAGDSFYLERKPDGKYCDSYTECSWQAWYQSLIFYNGKQL